MNTYVSRTDPIISVSEAPPINPVIELIKPPNLDRSSFNLENALSNTLGKLSRRSV